MDTVQKITLIISGITLLLLIINTIFTYKHKKKDRRIIVTLDEKRKMNNELFNHITSVLDIGRRCYDVDDIFERRKMEFELLNHKIFIWINLNRKNKYAEKMRNNCNNYIFWCASSLRKEEKSERQIILINSDKDAQEIWLMIDNYIVEENKLTNKLI